jgi:signal-transduction protein with cAMP-binding, CBS, and nucleotidyltransferase domain
MAGTLEESSMTNKKRICVQDVMKSTYGSIDGRSTIREALIEMRRVQTAVLVVNKSDEHDEYGLLLVSDIVRQVLAKNRAPERVNVYEIMTKPVVCIEPDMDICNCSRLMAELNLMRVLVVKDKVILGTLSPRALALEGMAAMEVVD